MATTAAIYADGIMEAIGSVDIPSLVPGETYSVATTWTATAEVTSFVIVLDPSDQVAETDEYNNEPTLTL